MAWHGKTKRPIFVLHYYSFQFKYYQMKNLAAIAFLLSLLFACGNPCDDLDCGLNGTCNEDTESCICDDFYEGTNCELEVRAKFLGSWTGTGVCDYNPTSVFDLTLDISQAVNLDGVAMQSEQILQQFTISGNLDDNNDIAIPEFKAHIGSNDHDGKLVHLGDSNIELTLNAYVNGVKNTCVYTLSK